MPQQLVVNVSRDGKFLMGGQERTIEDVGRLIGAAKAGNPQQAVVIRGDKQVILQCAVNVLDMCEKHGIEHAYLTTVQEGR